MANIITSIERLYDQGIYPYSIPYADYVDICVDGERTSAPASSALLAMQVAAKDMQFTGKVTVEYRLDPNGNPAINVFSFIKGNIISVDRFCSYSIYGQDQILRKLGIKGA